jgi:hypothetical protein
VEAGERPALVRLDHALRDSVLVEKKDATGLNFPVASKLSQPSAMAGCGANRNYSKAVRLRGRSGDRLPVPGCTVYSD